MWDTEIGDCEGIRIELAVLKIVEVLLCDARVRVEEHEEYSGAMLGSPRRARGKPSNDEIAGVSRWLKHFFQGLGVIKEPWDMFEDRKGNLEEDCKSD